MPTQPAPLPPPPRKVRRTKKYITGTKVFAVLTLLTLPWWCVPEFAKYNDVRRLLHSGVMTTATVTDSTGEDHFRAGTVYRVTVKFVDNSGRLVSSDTDVDYRTYSSMSIGGTVMVTYLPGDTEVCRVGKVTPAQVMAVVREFLIGFGAMAGFYLLIALGIAVDDRRQSGLLRNGEVVSASVDRLSRAKETIYEVAYSFELGGKTYKAVDRIDRKVLKAPTVGETVDVLYLPTRPSTAMAVAAMVNFEVVLE